MMLEQIPYEDEQEYWPDDSVAPYENDQQPSPLDDTKLLYRDGLPGREQDACPGAPPVQDVLARERQLLGLREERVP
jgi:hypothetical protein